MYLARLLRRQFSLLDLCTPYWIIVLTSPYWIFGSTVERTRRLSSVVAAAGSDVIAPTGNTTMTHAPDPAYHDTLLDHLTRSDLDLKLDPDYADPDLDNDVLSVLDLDVDEGVDPDGDLDPESWRPDDLHLSPGLLTTDFYRAFHTDVTSGRDLGQNLIIPQH